MANPRAEKEQNEKLLSTPDTKFTETESLKSPTYNHKPPAKIEGTLPDLLYGGLLPCVPVVLVSTLLLTIILTHRVKLDRGWEQLIPSAAGNGSDLSFVNRTLELKVTGGDAAYLIRYNPAILAAIASWTSKILPFITGSSMAVIAFFAGRRILDATRDNQTGELPTPHQMSILIKLLSGNGAMPLWDTVWYKWQNHEHLVQPIPLAFCALSFVVIIT